MKAGRALREGEPGFFHGRTNRRTSDADNTRNRKCFASLSTFSRLFTGGLTGHYASPAGTTTDESAPMRFCFPSTVAIHLRMSSSMGRGISITYKNRDRTNRYSISVGRPLGHQFPHIRLSSAILLAPNGHDVLVVGRPRPPSLDRIGRIIKTRRRGMAARHQPRPRR